MVPFDSVTGWSFVDVSPIDGVPLVTEASVDLWLRLPSSVPSGSSSNLSAFLGLLPPPPLAYDAPAGDSSDSTRLAAIPVCRETVNELCGYLGGRRVARRARVDLVTHGRDGRVRSKDSYGNETAARDKER